MQPQMSLLKVSWISLILLGKSLAQANSITLYKMTLLFFLTVPLSPAVKLCRGNTSNLGVTRENGNS